jgi:hypothetical protein
MTLWSIVRLRIASALNTKPPEIKWYYDKKQLHLEKNFATECAHILFDYRSFFHFFILFSFFILFHSVHSVSLPYEFCFI